jgi:hypothetical protein
MKTHTAAFTLIVLLLGIELLHAQSSPYGAISFSAQNYSVAENAGVAVITVTLVRSNGSEGVLAVQCYTVNGSATEDDYMPVNTAVAFAPGETSKTFEVPILDDLEGEPNETILLVLTNVTCGVTLPGGAASITATLLIVDNEVNHGELTFNAGDYTYSETSGVATVTVIRIGGSVGVVSVQYRTASEAVGLEHEFHMATAGTDYQAVSGTLMFADGQTNRTFVVPIFDDAVVERDETMFLVLTNATGGATFPDNGFGTPVATLTILDNEPNPGELTFGAPNYSCSETSGLATISVIRTRGSLGTVSIQYYTADDTATAGQDYGAVSGTLIFANGQTNKTFTVPVFNDGVMQSEELLYLVLTNATGGATLLDELPSLTTTLGIIDSDMAPAAPMIIDYERQNSALRLRFTASPPHAYVVEFSASCMASNWFTLTNLHANNQPIEAVVMDSLTNVGTRFYRVRKQN